MNSMLDPRESFWDTFPGLTTAGPFKDIYKKDKTKGKLHSSKVSWCVALIWDKRSDFYNLPEEGPDNKLVIVFDDVLGKKNYYKENKELIDTLRDFYLKLNDTVAKRTLRGIEDKLIERDRFLKATPYPLIEDKEVFDVGEWSKKVDTIDKMLANTKKLYDLYDEARKVVEQEEQRTTKGDAQESLSDTGEI